MAADLAINNILPIAGFIGICTARPREFDIKAVSAAKERGLRVFMVSGEKDHFRPEQDEMIRLFEKAALPYKYHLINNLGHAFPLDFPDWIDRAIDFVSKK
jgi:pimeloyl-ACP methyl ester carboxylesterase